MSMFSGGDFGDTAFNPYAMRGGADPQLLQLQMLTQLQAGPTRNFAPPNNLGFGAIPGMGQFGPLLGMMLSGFTGQNYVPGPIFGSWPGGMSNVMQNRYEYTRLTQVMAASRAMDEQRAAALYRNTMMMENGGVETAAIRQAAAARAATTMDILTSTPGMVGLSLADMGGQMLGMDIMGWARPGLASARSVSNLSRGIYRGRGLFGLDAEETSRIHRTLADTFMPGGAYDLTLTKGLNLGQIGTVAEALQERGMLGSFRGDTDKSGISETQTKALTERVKSFTGVIKVMEEMTGSSDIKALMQGIQALTGGVGTMSPQQLEAQLGKLREVSRMAGVTLNTMTAFIQEGMAISQQLGLAPQFGANMSVQSVLAGHVATAFNGGSQDFLGKASFESARNQFQRQTIGAAGSQVGRRSGAAMEFLRMTAAARGTTVESLVGNNEILKQLVNASHEGGAFSEDLLKVVQGPAGAQNLAREIAKLTGGNASSIAQALQNSSNANRGLSNFPELAQNVGATQHFDYDRVIGYRLQATQGVMEAAKRMGVNVGVLSRALAEAADYSNPQEQNQAIAGVVNQYGGSLSRAERAALAAQLAPLAIGQRNQAFADQGSNPEAAAALYRSQADRVAAGNNLRTNSDIAKMLRDHGLGANGMAERIANFLLDPKNAGKGLKEALEETVKGDVPLDKMRDALKAPLQELISLREKINSGQLHGAELEQAQDRERSLTNALTRTFAITDKNRFNQFLTEGGFQTYRKAEEERRLKEHKEDKARMEEEKRQQEKTAENAAPIKVRVVSTEGKTEVVGTVMLAGPNNENLGKAILHLTDKHKAGAEPSHAH